MTVTRRTVRTSIIRLFNERSFYSQAVAAKRSYIIDFETSVSRLYARTTIAL